MTIDTVTELKRKKYFWTSPRLVNNHVKAAAYQQYGPIVGVEKTISDTRAEKLEKEALEKFLENGGKIKVYNEDNELVEEK